MDVIPRQLLSNIFDFLSDSDIIKLVLTYDHIKHAYLYDFDNKINSRLSTTVQKHTCNMCIAVSLDIYLTPYRLCKKCITPCAVCTNPITSSCRKVLLVGSSEYQLICNKCTFTCKKCNTTESFTINNENIYPMLGYLSFAKVQTDEDIEIHCKKCLDKNDIHWDPVTKKETCMRSFNVHMRTSRRISTSKISKTSFFRRSDR